MINIARERQRHARWMLPDAARWMRPDAARWLMPNQRLWQGPKNWEAKYSPDQPRVPAGSPDGGQWTSDGNAGGAQFAAGDKPSPSKLGLAIWAAGEAIKLFRSENLLYDLFGKKEGVVSYTTIDDKQFFGVNSGSDEYKDRDVIAAEDLRATLIAKYPGLGRVDNVGQWPLDGVFHAETTVLLRAARENGGSLAGLNVDIYVDRGLCSSCQEILPKIGLELGNPTVTFFDTRTGKWITMRDGSWIR